MTMQFALNRIANALERLAETRQPTVLVVHTTGEKFDVEDAHRLQHMLTEALHPKPVTVTTGGPGPTPETLRKTVEQLRSDVSRG